MGFLTIDRRPLTDGEGEVPIHFGCGQFDKVSNKVRRSLRLRLSGSRSQTGTSTVHQKSVGDRKHSDVPGRRAGGDYAQLTM
jgi:hypothetical protein